MEILKWSLYVRNGTTYVWLLRERKLHELRRWTILKKSLYLRNEITSHVIFKRNTGDGEGWNLLHHETEWT